MKFNTVTKPWVFKFYQTYFWPGKQRNISPNLGGNAFLPVFYILQIMEGKADLEGKRVN